MTANKRADYRPGDQVWYRQRIGVTSRFTYRPARVVGVTGTRVVIEVGRRTIRARRANVNRRGARGHDAGA